MISDILRAFGVASSDANIQPEETNDIPKRISGKPQPVMRTPASISDYGIDTGAPKDVSGIDNPLGRAREILAQIQGMSGDYRQRADQELARQGVQEVVPNKWWHLIPKIAIAADKAFNKGENVSVFDVIRRHRTDTDDREAYRHKQHSEVERLMQEDAPERKRLLDEYGIVTKQDELIRRERADKQTEEDRKYELLTRPTPEQVQRKTEAEIKKEERAANAPYPNQKPTKKGQTTTETITNQKDIDTYRNSYSALSKQKGEVEARVKSLESLVKDAEKTGKNAKGGYYQKNPDEKAKLLSEYNEAQGQLARINGQIEALGKEPTAIKGSKTTEYEYDEDVPGEHSTKPPEGYTPEKGAQAWARVFSQVGEGKKYKTRQQAIKAVLKQFPFLADALPEDE